MGDVSVEQSYNGWAPLAAEVDRPATEYFTLMHIKTTERRPPLQAIQRVVRSAAWQKPAGVVRSQETFTRKTAAVPGFTLMHHGML
jgi:hypothetical protein